MFDFFSPTLNVQRLIYLIFVWYIYNKLSTNLFFMIRTKVNTKNQSSHSLTWKTSPWTRLFNCSVIFSTWSINDLQQCSSQRYDTSRTFCPLLPGQPRMPWSPGSPGGPRSPCNTKAKSAHLVRALCLLRPVGPSFSYQVIWIISQKYICI